MTELFNNRSGMYAIFQLCAAISATAQLLLHVAKTYTPIIFPAHAENRLNISDGTRVAVGSVL